MAINGVVLHDFASFENNLMPQDLPYCQATNLPLGSFPDAPLRSSLVSRTQHNIRVGLRGGDLRRWLVHGEPSDVTYGQRLLSEASGCYTMQQSFELQMKTWLLVKSFPVIYTHFCKQCGNNMCNIV